MRADLEARSRRVGRRHRSRRAAAAAARLRHSQPPPDAATRCDCRRCRATVPSRGAWPASPPRAGAERRLPRAGGGGDRPRRGGRPRVGARKRRAAALQRLPARARAPATWYTSIFETIDFTDDDPAALRAHARAACCRCAASSAEWADALCGAIARRARYAAAAGRAAADAARRSARPAPERARVRLPGRAAAGGRRSPPARLADVFATPRRRRGSPPTPSACAGCRSGRSAGT